jgi:sodium/bile acid cotransporter 7
LLFCGSKKVWRQAWRWRACCFPPAQVGIVVLPIMLFHQLQLIACAVIARRLADTAETANVADDIRTGDAM